MTAFAAIAGNLNDLWYDPAEPGWGVNVAEQGDVLFLTLFVYDPQGRPLWLVGSDTRRFYGELTYKGPLYLASGPPFTGAFDPRAVSLAEVGNVEFTPFADGTASVAYSFADMQFTKKVQRQTWRRIHIDPMLIDDMNDAMFYTVPYIGTFQLAAFNSRCPVNAGPTAWENSEKRFTLTMTPQAGAGGSFQLRTEHIEASGSYEQAGSIIRVSMKTTVQPDPAAILPAGDYRVSIDPLIVDGAFVHGYVTFVGVGFPCAVQFAMAGHMPAITQSQSW